MACEDCGQPKNLDGQKSNAIFKALGDSPTIVIDHGHFVFATWELPEVVMKLWMEFNTNRWNQLQHKGRVWSFRKWLENEKKGTFEMIKFQEVRVE